MPHLQFDLNFTPKPQDKTRFADAVVQHFGKVMDTGTDHVAVTLRCGAREDLVFGRAGDPSRGIAFLNADLRGYSRACRGSHASASSMPPRGRYSSPTLPRYPIRSRSSRNSRIGCVPVPGWFLPGTSAT